MKEIVKITDYKDYQELLVSNYKEKPNFIGILDNESEMFNDLENSFFEIKNEYDINTAVGIQLDILGNIQGISRGGYSDADYRDRIKTKIIINNGSGGFETIISYISGLLNANKVQIHNIGNAKFSIWTDIEITQNMFDQIQRITMAGVGMYISFGSMNPFVTKENSLVNSILFTDDVQFAFTNLNPAEYSDSTVFVNEEDPDGQGCSEAIVYNPFLFTDNIGFCFTDLDNEFLFPDSLTYDNSYGGELQETRQNL